MEARFRTRRRKIKQHLGTILIVTTILVVATTLIIVEVIVNGAGFQGKTLWDWLQLLSSLAIPVVVGFGAVWFTTRQGKVVNTENKDNQRETALQTYIDKMSELLQEKNLRNSAEEDEVRKIARVRTITVLTQLDARRVGYIFAFLGEAKLMSTTSNDNAVSLSNADLHAVDWSEANLSKVNLSEADLKQANLSKAHLLLAHLNSADLSGADLSGADLSYAHLLRSDLSRAKLVGADLSHAHLVGADLRGAKLVGADLGLADLSGAGLRGADLRGAGLGGTKLSGADLRGANLSHAHLYKNDLSFALQLHLLPQREGTSEDLKKPHEHLLVHVTLLRRTNEPQESQREGEDHEASPAYHPTWS